MCVINSQLNQVSSNKKEAMKTAFIEKKSMAWSRTQSIIFSIHVIYMEFFSLKSSVDFLEFPSEAPSETPLLFLFFGLSTLWDLASWIECGFPRQWDHGVPHTGPPENALSSFWSEDSVKFEDKKGLFKAYLTMGWAELLSLIRLFVALWTVTHQAPVPMGFSWQDYWSGLLYLPPGHLIHPRMESTSPALQAN